MTAGRLAMNSGRTTLLFFICALSILIFNGKTVNSFLFPKPPPIFKTKTFIGGPIGIQNKLIKCKAQKKKRCLIQKKRRCLKKKSILRKKAFLAGAIIAGPPLTLAAGVAATTAAAVALNNVEPLELYTPTVNSLNGQSILITGGTTGLGLETAKRLVIGRPDNLIITARSDIKGQTAVDEIYRYLTEKSESNTSDDDEDNGMTESYSTNVSYRVLDLDDISGIENSVSDWLSATDDFFPSKLDCVVNNAGVMNLPKQEITIDGVERQMASNHLGHFVLTKLLTPILSENAKIISVSSSAHQMAKMTGGMDFDYCWDGSPKYDAWKSYGQSKLANILFSQELQRRSNSAGLNWDVACLHPGVVSTDLWRQALSKENYERVQDVTKSVEDSLPNFLKDGLNTLATKTGDLGVFKTVEQGATTSIWLAAGGFQSDDDYMRTNAQYYDNCKSKSLEDFAKDSIAAERLWEESEERAGISFNFDYNQRAEDELSVDESNDEIDNDDDTTTDDSTNDMTTDEFTDDDLTTEDSAEDVTIDDSADDSVDDVNTNDSVDDVNTNDSTDDSADKDLTTDDSTDDDVTTDDSTDDSTDDDVTTDDDTEKN